MGDSATLYHYKTNNSSETSKSHKNLEISHHKLQRNNPMRLCVPWTNSYLQNLINTPNLDGPSFNNCNVYTNFFKTLTKLFVPHGVVPASDENLISVFTC